MDNLKHNCRFCGEEFVINTTDEDIKVVCPSCGRQDGHLSAILNAIRTDGPLFKNKREELGYYIYITFIAIPINKLKITLLKIELNYIRICNKILKCFIDR